MQKKLKGTPASQPDNLVVERLVPVPVSPDSALLVALFSCDSTNRVIMEAYNETKSGRMDSQMNFKDGKLEFQASTAPDTVFLPARDSIVYVEREVPVQVNVLTWWQEFWIRTGKILSAGVLLLLAPGLWKIMKKLI